MSALLSSLSLSLSLSLVGTRVVVNPMFYFSLATLVFGIAGAGYLLIEWIHHRRERRFALFWAIGLFSLYWFQVPAILSNANRSFILTDFNAFFSFAFLAAFIGNLFIYAGILSVSRLPNSKRAAAFVIWAALAAILFFFYFANRSTITNYSAAFISIFGFFMPPPILSFIELMQWRKKFRWSKIASFGVIILMASFLAAVFQNIYTLDRLLQYPPEFWFLAIANSSALFVMQALGTLLLLLGFILAHRDCSKIAGGNSK